MGPFGERIERQQPPGVVDAQARLAAAQAGLDQGAEGLEGRLSQPLLAGHHPVFERRAVADVEAGEELAVVEPRRHR